MVYNLLHISTDLKREITIFARNYKIIKIASVNIILSSLMSQECILLLNYFQIYSLMISSISCPKLSPRMVSFDPGNTICGDKPFTNALVMLPMGMY